MKKRLIVLMTLITLGTVSCGKQSQETTVSDETPSVVSSGLVTEAEFPEDYPKSLDTYQACFFEPDLEKVTAALMLNDPDETFISDSGDYHALYGEEEHLEVNTKNCIIGYIRTDAETEEEREFKSHIRWLKSMATEFHRFGNNAGLNPGHGKFKDFDQEAVLSFSSKKEVTERFFNLIENAGFPEMDVRYVYPRNKDILTENLKIYNGFSSIEENQYVFTEEDEDYYLMAVQKINGIPLCCHRWILDPRSEYQTDTYLEMIYTKDSGVDEINAWHLFDIKEKTGVRKIRSPLDAVREYERLYGENESLKGTTLSSVELNYIVTQKDGNLTALPCWILVMWKDRQLSEDVSMRQYTVIAIDPETLEIYNK